MLLPAALAHAMRVVVADRGDVTECGFSLEGAIIFGGLCSGLMPVSSILNIRSGLFSRCRVSMVFLRL